MPNQYVTVQTSGAEGYSNLKIWLRDISAVVPGIQRTFAKRQLLLACREFFGESFAWRAAMGPINVVGGKAVYALSPFNSYTDVIGVLAVEQNGVPLSPLYRQPSPFPGVLSNNFNTDFPSGYYMLRPDILALYPPPKDPLPSPLTLQVYVALKPKVGSGSKISCEQVPEIAVTDFYEPILCGVLYRLLGQPAKPYSNPALAGYYEKRFRAYIGQFAGRAKTGFNGSASWSFPRFGK